MQKQHMTRYCKCHNHVNNTKNTDKTVHRFGVTYNPNHTKTGDNKTTKTQRPRQHNPHIKNIVSTTRQNATPKYNKNPFTKTSTNTYTRNAKT